MGRRCRCSAARRSRGTGTIGRGGHLVRSQHVRRHSRRGGRRLRPSAARSVGDERGRRRPVSIAIGVAARALGARRTEGADATPGRTRVYAVGRRLVCLAFAMSGSPPRLRCCGLAPSVHALDIRLQRDARDLPPRPGAQGARGVARRQDRMRARCSFSVSSRCSSPRASLSGSSYMLASTASSRRRWERSAVSRRGGVS